MTVSRKQRLGMTLIETLVATAITLVVIAGAASVLVAFGQMSSNAQESAGSNDASRMAEDAIVLALRSGAIGCSGGLYVSQNGTPTLINAIYGRDDPLGTDDLWVVTANRNMLRNHCTTAGAAATVVAAGTGQIQSTCTATFDPTKDMLLASNMITSALLTGLVLTPPSGNSPGVVNYAQSGVAGFSNAPSKGGFQIGDVLFPAVIYHFYVAPDTASGTTGLWRAQAELGDDAYGRPFKDSTTKPRVLIQRNVEDLQVAFGVDTSLTGAPGSYTWQNGLTPTPYLLGVRSVRVTVVATSEKPIRNWQGQTQMVNLYKPVPVENHVPAGPADGHRRVVYTRRIELTNLSPENM